MRYKLILLVFLVCWGSARFSIAESDPGKTILALTEEMRAARSAEPLVNYVHWDSLFQGMPETERKMLNATSPQELKKFFRQMLADPMGYMSSMIEAPLDALPAEQRKQMEPMLKPQLDRLEQEVEKMQHMIETARYRVNSAKVKGDSATVELVTIIDGKEKVDFVPMVKVGGAWLLTAPKVGAAGAPGT